MNKVRLYKGRVKDTLEWQKGFPWQGGTGVWVIPYNIGVDITDSRLKSYVKELIPETLCEDTGYEDSFHNSIWTNDFIETNVISGTLQHYIVGFREGSYGLESSHNGIPVFTPFTSIVKGAHLKRVGNKYDRLDESYYTRCDSADTAMVILEFIRDRYNDGKAGTKKYVDAIDMAIESLHKSVSKSRKGKK